jgi:hypothetical protein
MYPMSLVLKGPSTSIGIILVLRGPNVLNLTHEDLIAVLYLSMVWKLVKVIVLGICIPTC